MKIWNLNVKRGADGSKHLDIQMHGVIDGGFFADKSFDTSDAIDQLNQHLDAKTVKVRINSFGGDVFGGIAMYNALQAHPGEVTCVVEGMAASAASLVALAGKTVMGKGAMMMIHPPAAALFGNSVELRKMADVLDKVQDSLATIYTTKTGKSVDEINDMLDAETYMTADEAVAAGFADEVMPDVKTDYGPGNQVPAEQDDGEDGDGPDESVDDRAPHMTADGAGVIWAGVTFPVASLPQQILAMAKKPPATVQTPAAAAQPPTLAVVAPPAAAPPPAPIVALEPPITREVLDRRSPELVKALLDEGRAAGVAAERARLQAIDDLGVAGCAELVAAAKYGDKPMDAPALAMAVIKANKVAGTEFLAMRRKESEVLAGVVAGAPDQSTAAAEARLVKLMVDGGNARRGGNVR